MIPMEYVVQKTEHSVPRKIAAFWLILYAIYAWGDVKPWLLWPSGAPGWTCERAFSEPTKIAQCRQKVGITNDYYNFIESSSKIIFPNFLVWIGIAGLILEFPRIRNATGRNPKIPGIIALVGAGIAIAGLLSIETWVPTYDFFTNLMYGKVKIIGIYFPYRWILLVSAFIFIFSGFLYMSKNSPSKENMTGKY